MTFGTGCKVSICGNLNCEKCCQDREIILTHDDINRLLTMGHYEQTFARASDWGYNLKEMIFQDGKCVFLKDGNCSVYDNRPTACRIFPLTIGEHVGMIDSSCPHAIIFEKDERFLSEANHGLKRIIEDIESTITKTKNNQTLN